MFGLVKVDNKILFVEIIETENVAVEKQIIGMLLRKLIKDYVQCYF